MPAPADPRFRDHFSGVAEDYAAFRPQYPPALFAALAAKTRHRDVAWDCATGSGQAAVGLAAHFARVVGTDGSPAQLAAARSHAHVRYLCALAEVPPLAAGGVDLLSAAQAPHSFDIARFFAEVRRVLAPGGLGPAGGYRPGRVRPAPPEEARRFFTATLGPSFPP